MGKGFLGLEPASKTVSHITQISRDLPGLPILANCHLNVTGTRFLVVGSKFDTKKGTNYPTNLYGARILDVIRNTRFSALPERSPGHNSMTLEDGYQAVCGLSGVFLDGSRGPDHLNVGRGFLSESKMEAGIIHRHIACLAQDSLGLGFASIANKHACANRAAIALCAFQANLDPVVLFRSVVAQQ